MLKESKENFKVFIKGLWYTVSTCTKSIWEDLHSWTTIKKNRWHLHAMALPSIILYNLIAWYFNLDVVYSMGLGGNIVIQGLLCFFVAFGFEFVQGKGIITKKQKFESNKDGFFTMYMGWIGLLISMLIFPIGF
jgi:hypothetical protein